MFEAENIMNKNVITVAMDTPLYKAMGLLVEKHISGVPVVDNEKRVVGIITEKDMLKILIENKVNTSDVVADHMTKKVVCFSPKDNIANICEFLIKNNYRRVPIVKDGFLVGIIARRDIISFILKLRDECMQGK